MSVPVDAKAVPVSAELLAAEVGSLLDAPEPEGDFRDSREAVMLALLLLNPPDKIVEARG
ncbi:hypothetical protein ACQPZF_23000 [Actinosynnema sp. CS-041913]|uniref:hypothetical protein n=1 Tax=Actinosynnema sp. CS-041913 TaxID=3239917 RepID=UPI003D8D8B69